MDTNYESLRDLACKAMVSDEEWKLFAERSRVREVRKGTCLVETGEMVMYAYYCASGLFRLFYPLPDGKEYNVAFTLENDFATSYGAMVKRMPSSYTIEALEDSVVIEISYESLQEIMDSCHSWERFVRKSVERLYIRKEERERELLFLSALQRYEAFLVKYPGLENRIPQYHVASYLGISPVSLSRMLRAKRA
ncbi:Crp/Fnr family transcriptional regulator [Paenibacillus tuaregi]|uniref:Crp/Fnr family transcriptional regulator n=1 Tax=Paenibacillus tuaregi TaxID=1816681 RepID=UPI00083903EC|nr:Crp/Fnr family transcriptional regulator [Paenibacillus tuaregi]